MDNAGKGEVLVAHSTRVVVALCAVALIACVGITPETKMKISQPVDCSSAFEDIAHLENAHAGGGKRIFQGLMGVMPPSIIVSLFRAAARAPEGMYLDHWSVAWGTYNEKMDDKIASIRQKCDL